MYECIFSLLMLRPHRSYGGAIASGDYEIRQRIGVRARPERTVAKFELDKSCNIAHMRWMMH